MKPTVLISRCLGFAACRYDGSKIRFELLEKMKSQIQFITICPETAIGLPVPRDTLRLVKKEQQIRLIQPATGRDLTDLMQAYGQTELLQLPPLDGCILKSRSPSCGTKDIKIYSGAQQAPVVEKGAGLFAEQLIRHNPQLPIEDEGRLMNLAIREHFLTKLYLNFGLRQIKDCGDIRQLIRFQANNKYLYFAYDQNAKNKLGAIVANHAGHDYRQVWQQYSRQLAILLDKMPSKGNYINAFQHIFGYFSKQLSAAERNFVLDLMAKYKTDQVGRAAITSVLKGYVIQYEIPYLLDQTIFQPFPEELVSLADSGK